MYYAVNIEEETIKNTDYRRVLYTPGYQQLVLMSIPPGEDIPLEVHHDVDQFFRIEKGRGEIRVGKSQNDIIKISDGSGVIIKHGTYHRVINTGSEDLKLYTIYSPPEHPPNRVDKYRPSNNHKSNNKNNIKLLLLSLL